MRRVLLCILDGWGIGESSQTNALSHLALWHKWLDQYPSALLDASGAAVGLPDGQMGNSEVGHMTIGLGRIIEQDLPRINRAMVDNTIPTLPDFKNFVQQAKEQKGKCHILGLFSAGGVHAHESHFLHMIELLTAQGLTVVVHPILDGRDTAPRSAQASLEKLEKVLSDHVHPGTICGRYYAMDRDNRWERTQLAHNVFFNPQQSNIRSSFLATLDAAYQDDVTDEFLLPCSIDGFNGIEENDSLCFINFRADRARQIMEAFVLPNFTAFNHRQQPLRNVLTMVDYSDKLSPYHHTLFRKSPTTKGLSETIAAHSLKQYHIAETEKYAHVTYFFNGGRESPFLDETHFMVPSPKVATYDLSPEMSAEIVTQNVISVMQKKEHHLIVVNYANPDMVGHTGIQTAIISAVQCIEQQIVQLIKEAHENDWLLCITADHGNVEQMCAPDGSPHTAHTCNPVPFIVINADKHMLIKQHGGLADISPTILYFMGLPIPDAMTGKILVDQ